MQDRQKTKQALIEELQQLQSRLDEMEAAEHSRESVQQAFNESETRYRSVFENTGTATIIIENDMSISMVNARFIALSGYSREEIEGRMKWTDFVVNDDIERMMGYHVQRRQNSQSAPNEYECGVKSRIGEIMDMHVRIDMIPGTMKSVASFMDVTAFKKAEAALRESERKLSRLMSHLPGMAYRSLNDDKRTMLFASDGCAVLTGYRPAELVGSERFSIMSLMEPEDRDRVMATIREMLSCNRAFQMEYRIRTADGQIKWVWDEGMGIPAENGTIETVEGFISDITEHKREELQLRRENINLKSTIRERFKFGEIIGKNREMQEIYERISKAAATDANVIISGESGTGKELVARAIHNLSDRAGGPFVAVNCSAVPGGLFESEFFGYRKGAFTGATSDKPGFFEQADGGTLFLDEVGEIDINGQAKLLRVIEGSGYTPVGGREIKRISVRIIGATNRDLKKEVREGRMRDDFFYRIHIIPISLPPLRARKDDLPLLIDHFLERYGKGKIPQVAGKILEALYNYDWPGNIRELQNVLQRYITLNTLDFMGPEPVLPDPAANDGSGGQEKLSLAAALDQYERNFIVKILEGQRWQKNRTASMLGMDRKTLFRKMKKHNLL